MASLSFVATSLPHINEWLPPMPFQDQKSRSSLLAQANVNRPWNDQRTIDFLGIIRFPKFSIHVMSRPSQRELQELRPVSIIRHYTKHAEGSVLVSFGDTKVLCTASIEERVPPFLRNKKQGWVTAEYGMLPRSTNTRIQREAARGKQSGRTMEISRLIGRSLRACIDLSKLGERTITLDCDVIQADGGTRTASITGAWVALADAVNWLIFQDILSHNPIHCAIASVSVGIYKGEVVTDLDYSEDSQAETDMNVVMNDKGGIIEIQGTAEDKFFDRASLNTMLDHAEAATGSLFMAQKEALNG